MVAISGCMTADKTVENKLSELSLSISKHIAAVVTDGASALANFCTVC